MSGKTLLLVTQYKVNSSREAKYIRLYNSTKFIISAEVSSHSGGIHILAFWEVPLRSSAYINSNFSKKTASSIISAPLCHTTHHRIKDKYLNNTATHALNFN
jgi:hypothetical protein